MRSFGALSVALLLWLPSAASPSPCAEYRHRAEVTDYVSLPGLLAAKATTRIGDLLYVCDTDQVDEVVADGLGGLAWSRSQSYSFISLVDIAADSGRLYVIGQDQLAGTWFLAALSPSLALGPKATTSGLPYLLVVDAPFAYVTMSNGTVDVFDVSNPMSPQLVQTVVTPYFTLGIAQSDTHLFLTGGTSSSKCDLMVYAKDPVLGPQFVTSSGTGPSGSGSFSFAAWAGGTVYVATNSLHRTIREIDVTDPTAPVVTGTIVTSSDLFWGDLVAGDTAAWLPTAGDGAVLVVDPSAQTVGSLRPFDSDELIVESGRMYAAGGGVMVAAQVLETQTIPTQALDEISAFPYGNAAGCAGLVVDGGFGYALTEGHDWLGGPDYWTIRKQDLTASPPQNWTARTPLTGEALALDVDGSSGAVVTEVSGAGGVTGIVGFQTTGSTAPVLRGSLTLPEVEDVVVSGSTAYVTSATQGIQIVDVGPNPPVSVGAVPTAGASGEIVRDGGRLYALDLATPALLVYDLSSPTAPVLLGSAILPALPEHVGVDGSLAVVTEAAGTVAHVVDVANPASPTVVGNVDTGATLKTVAVRGRTAYVGMEMNWVDGFPYHGVVVVDLAPPAAPAVREYWWAEGHTIDGSLRAFETRSVVATPGNVFVLSFVVGEAWIFHLPEQCEAATAAPLPASAPAAGLRVSPSPFAGETWIRFSVPRATDVRVSVHDVSGRRVRDLGESTMPAGAHSVRWDGRDDSGTQVAAGVYFVSVEGVAGAVAKVVRVR